MHPWDHARSSARCHGGAVEAYFPYHQWFDATKAVRAHFTHRALRHHREGIAEARRLFGDRLTVADGKSVDTEVLGRQHLLEDVGRDDVTAMDWLAAMVPLEQSAPIPDPEALACQSALRFGGPLDIYLPLHTWFLETSLWFDDPRHLSMRHHAFGVFEAEARFGPVLPVPYGRPVATRIVAERHVRTVMGSIPSADALLRRVRPER